MHLLINVNCMELTPNGEVSDSKRETRLNAIEIQDSFHIG